MRIVFLGTSAGLPTLNRGLAGIYIRVKNENILLDCGEGTQRQLLHADTNVTKINVILVSHLHGDHFFGLYGLLQSCTLLHRKTPLLIVCPPQIQVYLNCLMRYTPFHLSFPTTIVSPSPNQPIRRKGYTIHSIAVPHGTMAYGYCIEEHPYPGKFFPDKALALGIPKGPLWKTLQTGKPVSYQGKTVLPTQTSQPTIPGIKLVYSGDTVGNEALTTFAHKSDLLIHEATYLDTSDRPHDKQHATLSDTIQRADQAECKYLVLTHFSARYQDTKKYPNLTPSGIPIVYAEDLLEITINKDRKIKVNQLKS